MKSSIGRPDERRPYRMRTRAQAAEDTRLRVLAAASALFGAQLYDQVSLTDVARRAEVTVQTVIRRFGSKEQLLDETVRWRSAQTRGSRDGTVAGDIADALRRLVDDYERAGEERLHLLAQERRTPAIATLVAAGRRYHQDWVRRAFRPQLDRLDVDVRRQAYAQLVAVTDLYTWKLMRRDLGLDQEQAHAAITSLVTAIVGAPELRTTNRPAHSATPGSCTARLH